jgi:hypothetical protein
MLLRAEETRPDAPERTYLKFKWVRLPSSARLYSEDGDDGDHIAKIIDWRVQGENSWGHITGQPKEIIWFFLTDLPHGDDLLKRSGFASVEEAIEDCMSFVNRGVFSLVGEK